ncbi:ATP-binding cassette domain-containing protein [Alkalimarinus alittae]|uniref:ATP-binding cassette domain-containing protein n=1 Tax=Alkalimarinus alittae TaxID=2961619 RepID=A0ABY6N0Q9_9ALTE|nr:ATP-binding cassette domain-containing protein [Alkalimarinus alittae]UZE95697.1 ATP-binding cassette domain-containing protein [Alkalimarinus alittae]
MPITNTSAAITPASQPLFMLKSQSIGWGQKTVLEALDLKIEEGEKVAVVGKSGAGKSTLIHTLYQQHPEKIAYCSQEYGLVPSLSVFHNIYMGQLDQHHFAYNLVNLLRPIKSQITKIQPLAETLGLQAHLFNPAERLSGGQQQRVALARTLFQNKDIFIGDEPISSVDEVQSEHILALIMSHHNTTILTLHNADLALRFCSRIIGIRNGKIELDCATQDLSASQLRSLYQD